MKELWGPILIIITGLGWLLNSLKILPGVDWLWVGLLGGSGIAIIVVSGLDRSTVVAGPFLILASILSLCRQNGVLSFEVELPILFIGFGILLGLARFGNFPVPEWLKSDKKGG